VPDIERSRSPRTAESYPGTLSARRTSRYQFSVRWPRWASERASQGRGAVVVVFSASRPRFTRANSVTGGEPRAPIPSTKCRQR